MEQKFLLLTWPQMKKSFESVFINHINAATFLLFCWTCFLHLFTPTIHIMLWDELTQKFSHFDKITVFGCPRACRFRKYQI
jgi:hypothetical protein